MNKTITVVLDLEVQGGNTPFDVEDVQRMIDCSDIEKEQAIKIEVLDFMEGDFISDAGSKHDLRRDRINSNEELVIDLMNFSPYGALCQAFVMEAIQRYAKAVAAADAIDSDLVSGAAWKGIAVDIKARCDKFYNRHKEA